MIVWWAYLSYILYDYVKDLFIYLVTEINFSFVTVFTQKRRTNG